MGDLDSDGRILLPYDALVDHVARAMHDFVERHGGVRQGNFTARPKWEDTDPQHRWVFADWALRALGKAPIGVDITGYGIHLKHYHQDHIPPYPGA